MSYSYDMDTFKEVLVEHIGVQKKPSIIYIHTTERLKLPYGFVKMALEDGESEISCFTESDSILKKKVVKYKESWRIKESEDEDKEIEKYIEQLVKEIEKEEQSFSSPCTKKIGYISYYTNPPSFDTWDSKFTDPRNILKWIFTRKKQNVPSKEEIERVLKVEKPCFSSEERGVSFTWLGHASMFVRLDGINIITDPVFSKRASFLSFAGPKRYVEPPCTIEELPEIDIVVISHDHHDHLNMDAVRRINAKNPMARWYVPLGVDKLLKGEIKNIKGMSWGQQEREKIVIKVNRAGERIGNDEMSSRTKDSERALIVTCIPSQHWSSRFGYDIFSRLWSGWIVSVDNEAFYYAGDTGFCKKEFLKIGLRFKVSLAAIPIGCYEPSWFMHSQHVSPKEAVAIHEMIKAKKSVAVHWGTYDMGSSEGFLSPKEDLEEAIIERGLSKDEFITVAPGVTKYC